MAGRRIVAAARGAALVLRLALVAAVGMGAGPASAALSPQDAGYLQRIAAVESGGRSDLINQFGYAGMYQVGVPAAVDAGWAVRPSGCKGNDWSCVQWTEKAQQSGVSSIDSFLGNGTAQTAMAGDLLQRQEQYMRYYGLDQYVGKEINGRVMTRDDILAGIHFQGAGGMGEYLRSGGAVDPKDGNGLSVSGYIDRVRGGGGGGGGTTTAGGGGTGGMPAATAPPRRLAGCTDKTRQALAAKAQGAANAAVQQAAQVQRPAPRVLETCVGNLIRQLNRVKVLSADTGGINGMLGDLERQACTMLQQQFNAATGQVFSAQAFLHQQVQGGTSLLSGGTPGNVFR